MIANSGVGIGVREFSKVRGKLLLDLAQRVRLSEQQVLRIAKSIATPTVSTAAQIARELDVLIIDLQNVEYIAQSDLFIRLPYTIHDPALAQQVAEFNTPEVVKDYNTTFSPSRRCNVLLNFWDKIAEFEAVTKEYIQTGRAEYLRATKVQGDQPATEEELPEKLLLGETYSEIRQITDLTRSKIAQESGVSASLLSKLENDQADILVTNFSRIAQTFGLTPDEMIYIAYPPQRRWPMLLPYGIYHDQATLDRMTELNLQFSQLKKIRERAEVMLAFKQFSKRGVAVREPAALPEAFKMVKLWLLSPNPNLSIG